uniref:Ribonuclease H-like domain-containing protein n=1 Tax=Tanacetum cinerariifolium TaxID=118510 RepID=A0A6L2NSC8_TANCI|nr:ribonuclease H-like domain-containing protein [Tanacetum cinerariifolium]
MTNTLLNLRLTPPGIDKGIFDSEGDILFLEGLLNDEILRDLPPLELNNDPEGDIIFLEKILEDEPLEAKNLEIDLLIRESKDTFLMGDTETKFNPHVDIDDLVPILRNGNKVLKKTIGTVQQIYEPTFAKEKLDRKNEMKARGTLLMALPNKDQLKFHSYKDEKLLMQAIKKRASDNQENKGREYGKKTMLVENPTKNALIAQDGIGGYDWSYQAEEEHLTNYALVALTFLGNSSSLDSEENVKSRSDKGYHAVPPPYTGNYIPPKPDLTYIDEQVKSDSVDVVSNVASSDVKTVESKHEYADVKNKGVYSTIKTKPVRKNNFSPPIIKDWKFDDESEVEFEPKVEVKTVRPSIEKIKFVKPAREKVEKETNAISLIMKIMMVDLIPLEVVKAEFLAKNGIAERKNITLIEAARTMLVDSKLPTTFWVEVVNTACYVLNKASVIKPHNKTPYELICGRPPLVDFMKPFGCPVTILNTRDHLGKFDGKGDDRFCVGYSMVSKAIRVFNKRTRIVEETLNIRFLKNAPNVKGNGPDWLFDINSLTIFLNYKPVAGKQSNGIVGAKDNIIAGQAKKKKEPKKEYILIPICTTDPLISQGPKDSAVDARKKATEVDKSRVSDNGGQDDQLTRIVEEEVEMNNVVSYYTIPDAHLTKFLEVHLKDQVIGSIDTPVQTRQMTKINEEHDFVVYQMDVKSAFLYGKIEEEVYVCQPPSFKDPDFPALQGRKGSLWTTSGTRAWPDVTFAVCACARFQFTPKASHLDNVKRIFRYLKGQPKLGLWYPRDSPFDLEAYSDCDYARASLDKNPQQEVVKFLAKDRMERAATNASSLEAVQDSGNINKTQSMATLNEPLPQGTGLGSGPRRHLKLEDSDGISTLPNTEIFEKLALMGNIASAIIFLATNRTFNFSKMIFKGMVPTPPHDSPLPRGHTPGSDEGSLTLNELMVLFTLIKVSSQKDQPKDQLGVLSAAKILADETRVHTYSIRRRAVSTGSGGVSTASWIISTAEETVSTTKETVSTAGVSMPVSTASMVQESTSLPRATKDKGKEIMIESKPEKTTTNLRERQERAGYEAAIRSQEQQDEEENQRISKDAEIAQRLQEEIDAAKR